LLKYILLFITTTNLLLCNSNKYLATQRTIIPFQFTYNANPIFHFGGMVQNDNQRLFSGLQIQPTSNLIIGGLISPQKSENNLSLYYQIAIGYISNFKLLNLFSNSYQLSLHRDRFSANGDLRWFSFSVVESAKVGLLKMRLCWNHLFNNKWEEKSLSLSSIIFSNKKVKLRLGSLININPDISYIPYLFISFVI